MGPIELGAPGYDSDAPPRAGRALGFRSVRRRKIDPVCRPAWLSSQRHLKN